jgi:FixJ family two-component response regulator
MQYIVLKYMFRPAGVKVGVQAEPRSREIHTFHGLPAGVDGCMMLQLEGLCLRTSDQLTLAVVEDDEDVRTALDRLLRSMGHDVHLFDSAEAFGADPAPFDCLILDIRLPGASGLELSERLRSRGSRLPVVFITGDSEPSTFDGSRVIDPGSAPAVTKPFSEQTLMGAVARAMSQTTERA